jgi:predicted metalloendopeptidase
LTPNDVVVLEDTVFLQCFSRLIVFKPKRVIANYFGWRIAQTFGVYTVEALRKLKFNFDLVNSNAVTEESLSDICIKYLEDGLKWSLARIYVDKYFSRDDKREVKFDSMSFLNFLS